MKHPGLCHSPKDFAAHLRLLEQSEANMRVCCVCYAPRLRPDSKEGKEQHRCRERMAALMMCAARSATVVCQKKRNPDPKPKP